MKNAYESATQKVIPAVLLYAFFEGKVLMLHGREKDGMPGKWNGLGGKLEPGESMVDAAVREFQEESNCKTKIDQWRWLGQLYFPNFKAHKNEDWWVNVFITELTKSQMDTISLNDDSQPEGSLHLIDTKEAASLDLWDGDIHFLPFVFQQTAFEGTFFYENGSCKRYSITPLHLKK